MRTASAARGCHGIVTATIIGVIASTMIAVSRRPALGQTAPASTQPLRAPLVLVASVEAFWSADQCAKDTGYVSDVKADIGDVVTKGQVLAIIDDPELQQQLLSAQAMLAARQQAVKAAEAAIRQAQTAVDVAKRQLAGLEAEQNLAEVTLKRQEELFAGKAATGQQIDEVRAKSAVAAAATDVGGAKIAASEADEQSAEANRAVADAQVQVAAAEAQRLQTLVDYTKIVAPFDGVVTRRMVNPGDLVQAGGAGHGAGGGGGGAMFTCQKLDVVRVICDVPESNAMNVHIGDDAAVQTGGASGQVVHGSITRISSAVDPHSRTMRAEIDLPNPQRKLLPGMYAQVTLTPD
jgi:multidrug efflux pump subunit AcrA (membrane-fusion protein)